MATVNYYVALNLKTSVGFQTFGKFFLAGDKRLAYDIFQKLRGSEKITRDTIIHLELVETKDELPQNIQMISCTLDELAENCKIITKETFKAFNMAKK